MSGANVDVQNGFVSETVVSTMEDAWVIELSALRRATKLVERIQALDTPWPAAMHLGTALDALKEAQRLIEQRIT